MALDSMISWAGWYQNTVTLNSAGAWSGRAAEILLPDLTMHQVGKTNKIYGYPVN